MQYQWQKKSFAAPADGMMYAQGFVGAAANIPDYPIAAVLVANGSGVDIFLGRPGTSPDNPAGLLPGWELSAPPLLNSALT